MATLGKGQTFGATEEVTNTKLHALVDSGTVSGIVNADLSGTAAISNANLALLSGGTQGDVVYYNGSDWVKLGVGTSGQFLKTQGAAANPVWAGAGVMAHFISGASLAYVGATSVLVGPGTVELEGAILTRTANSTSMVMTTDAHFIGGSSQEATSDWFYVYAYNDAGSSWDVLLSNVAPDESDTSGNSAGLLQYYTTGGVYYRCLGRFYNDGSDDIQEFTVEDWTGALIPGLWTTVDPDGDAWSTGVHTADFNYFATSYVVGNGPADIETPDGTRRAYDGGIAGSAGSGAESMIRQGDTFQIVAGGHSILTFIHKRGVAA